MKSFADTSKAETLTDEIINRFLFLSLRSVFSRCFYPTCAIISVTPQS